VSFLARLFGDPAGRREAARDAAMADPVIDRMVAASDRRIAHIRGYRESLRRPVVSALEEVRAMIEVIPGPTEVSPRAWSRDDTVRTLFARGEDAAFFGDDPGVDAFFAGRPHGDCFALLALKQVERRVLANAMHGDSVHAEVARTTVSFTEPQVLAPAADEASARSELALRAMESLALRALERIGSQRVERHLLEKERSLLQAQLKLAARRGAGFAAIGAAPPPEGAAERAAVEQQLERVVADLERGASKNLLDSLLAEVLDVLQQPGQHLSVVPATLALDAMNFVVPPSPQAITPRVGVLRVSQQGPFAVVLARFPRDQRRARDDRISEAMKHL
jgi:hypothetical protein